MSTKVVEILGNDISSIIRKYLLPKQDKKSINYLNNIFKFINSGHIEGNWFDFKPTSLKYFAGFIRSY